MTPTPSPHSQGDRLVAGWADWATALVEQWPDDPAEAEPSRAVLERIVERADWG